MPKLLIAALFILPIISTSAGAHSRMNAWMTVNGDQTRATVIMTELGAPGALSELYDQLGLLETDLGPSQQKLLSTWDGAFTLNCKKVTATSRGALTTCRWGIQSGEAYSSVETKVSSVGNNHLASLRAHGTEVKLFQSLFPVDTAGAFKFETGGGVILKVAREPDAVTIEFESH